MSEPPHHIIVLEDADLLTLFHSECDADRARTLVRVVPDAPTLETASVAQVLAPDARFDQLFDRLQVLEESCRRLARSADDLEMSVQRALRRQPAVSIQTRALHVGTRMKTALGEMAVFIRSDRITRHMTVVTCLLLAVVLAGAPFLTRRHRTSAQSIAGSVRAPVRDARLGNIVLAADRPSIDEPSAKPMLTNGLAAQPPVASSTRTQKRAARFVGTLIVESRPAGAVVMVDQRKVGITPARISGIPAGSHALWVVGDREQRWTSAVTVRASSVTRVIAYLDRTVPPSLDGRRSPVLAPTGVAFSVGR